MLKYCNSSLQLHTSESIRRAKYPYSTKPIAPKILNIIIIQYCNILRFCARNMYLCSDMVNKHVLFTLTEIINLLLAAIETDLNNLYNI